MKCVLSLLVFVFFSCSVKASSEEDKQNQPLAFSQYTPYEIFFEEVLKDSNGKIFRLQRPLEFHAAKVWFTSDGRLHTFNRFPKQVLDHLQCRMNGKDSGLPSMEDRTLERCWEQDEETKHFLLFTRIEDIVADIKGIISNSLSDSQE